MIQQTCYDFTLVLAGVNDITAALEDQLFEAGCDDALLHVRQGTVYLDFSRQAASVEDAIISAIQSVESLAIGVTVISILPDGLVTEAEIAKRLKKSRQSVSLWVNQARRQTLPFPKPVAGLSDKSLTWRWFEVVQWLYQQRLIDDKALLDTAKLIENINAVLGERDPTVQAYRHHILNRLQRNH